MDCLLWQMSYRYKLEWIIPSCRYYDWHFGITHTLIKTSKGQFHVLRVVELFILFLFSFCEPISDRDRKEGVAYGVSPTQSYVTCLGDPLKAWIVSQEASRPKSFASPGSPDIQKRWQFHQQSQGRWLWYHPVLLWMTTLPNSQSMQVLKCVGDRTQPSLCLCGLMCLLRDERLPYSRPSTNELLSCIKHFTFKGVTKTVGTVRMLRAVKRLKMSTANFRSLFLPQHIQGKRQRAATGWTQSFEEDVECCHDQFLISATERWKSKDSATSANEDASEKEAVLATSPSQGDRLASRSQLDPNRKPHWSHPQQRI